MFESFQDNIWVLLCGNFGVQKNRIDSKQEVHNPAGGATFTAGSVLRILS